MCTDGGAYEILLKKKTSKKLKNEKDTYNENHQGKIFEKAMPRGKKKKSFNSQFFQERQEILGLESTNLLQKQRLSHAPRGTLPNTSHELEQVFPEQAQETDSGQGCEKNKKKKSW